MRAVSQHWLLRLSGLISAMAICLSFSTPAHADACATGASMVATNVAFSPGYDFTDPVQHTTMVTSLRVTGIVNGCAYLVGAEGGIAGRNLSGGSAETMKYQLYTDSPLIDAFLDPLNGGGGGAANMLSFVGGSQPTLTLTYYFSIPASQYVPSGLYQDDVLLTLYSGTFLTPSPPIASASVHYETTVTGIFLLSLVPTGNAFDMNKTSRVMDFGTLSPGEVESVQALFKSNNSSGYKVYMRSDNSGQLKLAGGSMTIPYSLALSSNNSPNLIDIAGSPALTPADLQIAIGTEMAPSAGDRMDVSATIKSFSAQALTPGAYSDVITVTIVGN